MSGGDGTDVLAQLHAMGLIAPDAASNVSKPDWVQSWQNVASEIGKRLNDVQKTMEPSGGK